MPAFSQGLEKALHQALTLANERHHEYATLEHLLLALIDDARCGRRDARLQRRPRRAASRPFSNYIDTELDNLVTGYDEDSKPTAGFQRVIQRAVIHVQSSGREEVTGANVLVAIFAERESHAAYFLQEQQMTRYDAVNYISHGIAKRPGAIEARSPRGAEEDQSGSTARGPAGGGRQEEAAAGRADGLLRQPQQEGQGRQDRSADRPRIRDQPHHPGALPPFEEQSALRRRSRRRQDGDRRRSGQAHRRGRRAGSAAERHHLRARHGHAARRHPLSRRFRGAAEAGRQGARGVSGRHPVHRRDPHRDRRRRHLRRRDGCVEPAEAGAVVGRDPLHRLDHLQGIPPVLREGPGAGPPLPEDRRQRADASTTRSRS